MEIINLENQILEAISHIRNISKEKVIDRIVAQINNSVATNWDLESVKSCLNQMTAKSIISEGYKPLTIFASEDTFSQNNEQTNLAETATPPSRLILTRRKSEGSKLYEEIENVKTEFAELKNLLMAVISKRTKKNSNKNLIKKTLIKYCKFYHIDQIADIVSYAY